MRCSETFVYLLSIAVAPSPAATLSLIQWVKIPFGSTSPNFISFDSTLECIQDKHDSEDSAASDIDAPTMSRRHLTTALPLLVLLSQQAASLSLPQPAYAFDNAIPEAKAYADKPKRPGTPPRDLGVLPRTTEGQDNLDSVTAPGLRTCDGNPNCFSTTGDFELADRVQKGVDFLIAPWRPPPDDPRPPLATLADVVRAYPPGQGGTDGGGFKIQKQSDTYLYVQFESLKKGYIDDLEFATMSSKNGGGGGGILVRSASRVGYTDFGVNAVRLNYISAELRKKGWTIAEITPETHRDYWLASDAAREATFDASRRQMDGGENVQEQVQASQVFNR